MKKVLFMIINLIISILSFVYANNFYNDGKTAYGITLMITGIIFVTLYAMILGYILYKKLNKKNDLLIGGVALGIYSISYLIYMSIFSLLPNLNSNVYSILLVIFYISFLTLVLCITTIFHFWNLNNRKRYILYFLAITITVVLTLLLSSRLFKSLPVVIVESIKFLYFTGVILLFLYVLVLVIQKIVKPLKK